MVERILLVKLAALGDAVMASTLVPAIRARWPRAELAWVTGQGIAPLVRSLQGVDRVIEVDEAALLGGRRMAAARAMVRAWGEIGRGWDLALVAHTDARYALLARASGASDIRRFADKRGPRAGRWHGAEYARLLQDNVDAAGDVAGDVDANADLGVDANAAARPQANSTDPPLAVLRTDALPAARIPAGGGALILVAPGGGRNVLRDDALRRWPIISWQSAVETLVADGHRVVAIGGVGDAAEGAACAEAGATDLTAGTSLLELMALIRASDVVVTHDAGTLHLAILLRRPTVALFGPTRPDERIPSGAAVTVLSRANGLACAPCYDGQRYAICASNRCLNAVPSHEVAHAVQSLLSQPRSALRA